MWPARLPLKAAKTRPITNVLHVDCLAPCDHVLKLADLSMNSCVVQVRGNNDDLYDPEMAASMPATAAVRVGPVRFTLHHGDEVKIQRDALEYLKPSDGWQGVFDVVVTGHSHRPLLQRRQGGVLFLNPGSAGPRRGSQPRRIAVVTVRDEELPKEVEVCSRIKA